MVFVGCAWFLHNTGYGSTELNRTKCLHLPFFIEIIRRKTSEKNYLGTPPLQVSTIIILNIMPLCKLQRKNCNINVSLRINRSQPLTGGANV